MDKHERLRAALRREPVDRPPVALWRHFPVDDQRPEDLAAATLEFQELCDWDLVKVTPASSYCLRDWGVEDEWRGSPEGTREYTRRVIAEPADWTRLTPLDPRSGHLGAHLRALDLVREGLRGRAPFLGTIFSPLSQAKNLAGVDKLLSHLRQHPAQVKTGLRVVTETTLRFVREARLTGLAGLFYAMQLASPQYLTEQEYREFGEPLDRQILAEARGLEFNLLHLHGPQVMFDLARDYPAQIINWHDRESAPNLAEGQRTFPGAVCGGLRQWETLVRGTPEQVRAEAQDALRQTGGRGFILGTGCVAPIVAPRANLRAARAAVEKE